ncbi:hypothetical protein GmHk_05G013590 [Glycine max]|nr:hypothetical protein GmHk_05G013590 [Glycine max]
MCGVACQCLGFTSDSPQISASPHQLDFTPYASRSYSAQWNVSELLHDMHMLHSSHILGKMEVEEP